MENSNRRKALRVEDAVAVNVVAIPHERMGELEDYFQTRRSTFSMQSHLSYVSEQHLPSMRVIERKHPEIAGYLKFLEQQIEFVSAQIPRINISEDDTLIGNNTVWLSASGIQFNTTQLLGIDSSVELELSLLSINMHILTFAKIVRLEKSEDGTTLVSAEYSMLHEEDEETLIKHVHQIHVKQLRAKDAC